MCTTEKHIGFYQRRGQSIIYRLNDALDGLSCHLLAARPGDKEDYIKFAIFATKLRILGSILTAGPRSSPGSARRRWRHRWRGPGSSCPPAALQQASLHVAIFWHVTIIWHVAACVQTSLLFMRTLTRRNNFYIGHWMASRIKNTLYRGSHSVYLWPTSNLQYLVVPM